MKRIGSWLLAAVVGSTLACSEDGADAPVTDTAADTAVAIDTSVASDTTIEDTSAPEDSGAIDGGTDGAKSDAVTDAGACAPGAKSGSLAGFNDPASSTKAADSDPVKLTGVIALSRKFLVSKSKTGRCTYGLFVADAHAAFAPYSGSLVTARGTDAVASDSGGTFCTNGDVIANDVAPGDVLDLAGTYDIAGPSAATCGAGSPPLPVPNPATTPSVILCDYKKTGTAAVPTPLVVDPADLKSGAKVLQYAGGLVQINAVKAKTATMAGDTTFGTFYLDPSQLAVGDIIYYRGAATAPTVTVGQTFTSIVGVGYLDFCTWTLQPRTICDLTPTPGGATCP